MEAKAIVYKTIAVIIFAALFPTALTTLFAVNTSAWTQVDPISGNLTRNALAITLWNLTGWIILIFGGVMIFISER